MSISLDLLQHYLDTDLHRYTSRCKWSSSAAYASHELQTCLLKKFSFGRTPSKEACAEARSLFLSTNNGCGMRVGESSHSGDNTLLREFRKQMIEFFEPLNFLTIEDVVLAGKCGPGSSVEGGDVGWFSKLFDGPLTVTHELLYEAYLKVISKDPRWHAAEQCRRFQWGYPKIVKGSKLFFVPKNNTIARCAATEPTLNMFFQLGIGKRIEARLKEFFQIDLGTQQFVNRALACKGSIDGTVATLDLSSASDTISVDLIAEYVPYGFRQWLMLTRSYYCKIEDGKSELLKMVSTMGNGFTFPLETAIFSCAIAACYRTLGIPRITNAWSCFGDDIIVPTALSSVVRRLLHLLGFQVNDKKSFDVGPFRESCGGDYLSGSPVRGVHLRDLSTPSDFYVAINRLTSWSCRHNIPLWRTIRYLKTFVNGLYVPLHESDDAGIKVPSAKNAYQALVVRTQTKVIPWFVNPSGLGLLLQGGYATECYGSHRQWAPYVSVSTRVTGDKETRLVQRYTPCWNFSRGFLRTTLPSREDMAVFGMIHQRGFT